MKKTEQRWMHISTGLLVERGRTPDNSANDYRTVTVTWDDREWEEVEVVRYGKMSDGALFGSTFTKEQAEARAKQHKGVRVEVIG